MDKCKNSACPLFFHFNEVGHFDGENLRALRDGCLSVLKALYNAPEIARKSFPFFFFSGRGLAYDELRMAGRHSPVGSHWLILEPLKRVHVQKIILDSPGNFTLHNHLSESSFDLLIDSVIDWTGGPPRALLYTILVLEDIVSTYLFSKLKKGLKTVFAMFLDFIANNKLYDELGPCGCI